MAIEERLGHLIHRSRTEVNRNQSQLPDAAVHTALESWLGDNPDVSQVWYQVLWYEMRLAINKALDVILPISTASGILAAIDKRIKDTGGLQDNAVSLKFSELEVLRFILGRMESGKPLGYARLSQIIQISQEGGTTLSVTDEPCGYCVVPIHTVSQPSAPGGRIFAESNFPDTDGWVRRQFMNATKPPADDAPRRPCQSCNGTGSVLESFGGEDDGGQSAHDRMVDCQKCDGAGTRASADDAPSGRESLIRDAIQLLRDHRWDGETFSADLSLALSQLSTHPADAPIPMLLFCPNCSAQHIDAPDPPRKAVGERRGPDGRWEKFEYDAVPEWNNPPHRSHLCAKCGWIWRPADVATTGVAKLQTQGEKDESAVPAEHTFKNNVIKLRRTLNTIRLHLQRNDHTDPFEGRKLTDQMLDHIKRVLDETSQENS